MGAKDLEYHSKLSEIAWFEAV